ncbi:MULTISPECIES: DUF1642 domain-containing protein [Streptococcus]|uniref:DUF1642 domain-containing protein n=1 Tax=Streptococcus caledonicus TaxID=2614158 RepID=A0ABW0UAV7_9STRE|nr:DUF1642 domain-containing protein [Streptococcus sp. S784/96/1]
MNKQEAIEQIKQETYYHCGEKECYKDGCKKYVESDIAIDIINQINEPKKVVIPKFAAEWIEEYYSKQTNIFTTVNLMLNKGYSGRNVCDWANKNQEKFLKAILNGYEVEKEKLYYVNIPNVYHGGFGYNETFDDYSFYNKNDATEIRFELTESEIKQNHEWAWQWAVPVEEELKNE